MQLLDKYRNVFGTSEGFGSWPLSGRFAVSRDGLLSKPPLLRKNCSSLASSFCSWSNSPLEPNALFLEEPDLLQVCSGMSLPPQVSTQLTTWEVGHWYTTPAR